MIKTLFFSIALSLTVPFVSYAAVSSDGCEPAYKFSITTGKPCPIPTPTFTPGAPLTLTQLQYLFEFQSKRILELEKEVRELQSVKNWYAEKQEASKKATEENKKKEAEEKKKLKSNIPQKGSGGTSVSA